MEGKNELVMHLIIQSQTQEGNQSRKSQTKMQTRVRQRHWTKRKLGCVNDTGLSANYNWTKSHSYIGNDHQLPHKLVD